MQTIRLGPQDMKIVRYMAKKSEINGFSCVRGSTERSRFLKEDAICGQIGNFAGSKWLFGSPLPYLTMRWWANNNPKIGDGGYDLPALNLDFKNSRIRTSLPLEMHHLIIRPWERHPGWVYVRLLSEWEDDPVGEDSATVYVMGWASDEMLPPEPDAEGKFKGAYTIRCDSLIPLPPLRYDWLGQQTSVASQDGILGDIDFLAAIR